MPVRPMIRADLEAVTRLCAQLGYPSTMEQIERRFSLLEADPEAGLYVADAATGGIVGWVYVRGVRSMTSDPRAEIWGLIVDADHRVAGVGAALMRHAEQWAREQGYADVRLHSNVVRTEAHRFYQGLGYQITKTSYVLSKPLTPI
jgi:GNAT superfamily N-acetyltransferase